MRLRSRSPDILEIRHGSNAGLFLFGLVFLTIGVGLGFSLPYLECDPTTADCTTGDLESADSPLVAILGPALFGGVGLLAMGFGPLWIRSTLDRKGDGYRIRRRRPLLPAKERSGVLSEVTGTLERESGERSHFGLLTRDMEFLKLGEGPTGSRRLRAVNREVCVFLGLPEGAALEASDLRIGLGEMYAQTGGAAGATELRRRLETDPDDIAGFRELTISLVRLNRTVEAGRILRSAHGHHLAQGNLEKANRLAGIALTFGL